MSNAPPLAAPAVKPRKPSGAEYRRLRAERAASGVVDLTLRGVDPTDCQPLVASGDLSEKDISSPVRLGVALAQLLPQMVTALAQLGEAATESLDGPGVEPGFLTKIENARLLDRKSVV